MLHVRVAAISWLRSARAELSRRFNALDDRLDAWAERHRDTLRIAGLAVSFVVLAGAVALHAFDSGLAHAMAARCGDACTSMAGHRVIIALLCGAAAVVFVRVFAGVTSVVHYTLVDSWRHVRPGPPAPRVPRWVVWLHALIGLALFLAMTGFAPQPRGLFEISAMDPNETRVWRVSGRSSFGLILGWWICGRVVLKFFWLGTWRYSRFDRAAVR